MTGTCIYSFNVHELYVNPGTGSTCGATTYALDGRDDADPYCPTHGGTANPALSTSTTATGGASGTN
jgi:hypothetical protein